MRLALILLCLSGCVGELSPGTRPAEAPPLPTPPEETCIDGPLQRVPLRRLTFAEFERGLAQLTGTPRRPFTDAKLEDSPQRGFSNAAEGLTVDPTLVELVAVAAQDVAHEVVEREFDPGFDRRFELERRVQDGGLDTVKLTCCGDDAWNDVIWPAACSSANPPPASECYRLFYNAYRVHLTTWLDGPGTWSVSTRAFALPQPVTFDGQTLLEPDGGRTLFPARFTLFVNGRPLPLPAVTERAEAPQTLEVQLPAELIDHAGVYELELALDVDYHFISYTRAGADALRISRAGRPVPAQPLVRAGCDPAATRQCLDDTVDRFARLAWRTPLSDVDRETLRSFTSASLAAGDAPLDALELSLRRVLTSPRFLFRVESSSPTDPRRLSGPALATRLATLLWSGLPDDALLARAERGELDTDEGLRAVASQMLDDPRAVAWEEDFGGAWLGARLVRRAQTDPGLFPTFTPEVQAAMEQEVLLNFREALRSNAPARSLLDPGSTFVNDALAAHYGLPLPGSSTPVKVQLPPGPRGGLLTFGGVLAWSSKSTAPMPTRRGRWVLSQVLCEEPPPPPPGVPPESATAGLTVRQQFEQHARDPQCAGCHRAMDPLGFGLESFDADARLRTVDRAGLRIDASGVLPDGRTFDGPAGLRSLLVDDPRTTRCIAQHAFTYALNRGLSAGDGCTLDALNPGPNGTLRDVLLDTVTTPAFSAWLEETR